MAVRNSDTLSEAEIILSSKDESKNELKDDSKVELKSVSKVELKSDSKDEINDKKEVTKNENNKDEVEEDSTTDDDSKDEIKHPLEYGWTLYYFKNDYSNNWNENNLKISTVHYVEDFWSLYNHVRPASRLPIQCDYSFFKEGIKPEWEDSKNYHGGKWTINLDKKQRSNELDKIWLEAILCIIGELFEDMSQYICGIVVNIRSKGDKVCLWTADADNMEATLKIGRIFREKLRVPESVKITYQAHTDSIKKKGSMAKNRYAI